MKIFTVSQIKECENATISKEGISSLDLMERAAAACCSWIKQRFNNSHAVLVVCGMGNNGGDGMALTRMLLQEGYAVKCVVLKHAEQFSENTSENFKLLHSLAPENISILEGGFLVSELDPQVVIIDALFGIGLNRPLSGWVATFVDELNRLPNTKIAIDIPSGLPADTSFIVEGNKDMAAKVLEADFTLTFQFFKRSFLHAETACYAGEIHLLDIGFNSDFIENAHARYHTLDLGVIRQIYKKRNPFSHKGTYGTVALAGGAYGKIGAMVLSAQAALRTGAGKVFVHAPSCGYQVLQAVVPEAMFERSGVEFIEELNVPEGSTVGIGPGMGMHEHSMATFRRFLLAQTNPLVVDADAINILSVQKDLLAKLPAGSLLTPHPKEFSRLFGKAANSMMQAEMAKHNAMKYNVFIVLKGHHTVVACPDGTCWYNTNGNSGLATAGSGDVLTGMLTALLAQGYSSKNAALMAVFLHGLAADIAVAESSEESLLAGDLPLFLGRAFSLLRSGNQSCIKAG